MRSSSTLPRRLRIRQNSVICLRSFVSAQLAPLKRSQAVRWSRYPRVEPCAPVRNVQNVW